MRKLNTTQMASLGLALVQILIAKSVVHAQEKTEKAVATTVPVPNCPVTGNPANLAVSTPTPEGPVFFCCKDCVAKYKAEPDKFAEAVAAQRAILAQRPRIQVKCPVSGEPPDRKIKLEKSGQTIRFCSEECRKKFTADPSKYASALANSYTYQTMCPVMNEPIDPTTFMKLPSGETVYICCKGCDKKLLDDPEKYAPGFRQQGFVFDFTKPQKDEKKQTNP